jgi:hypothetical protein
MNVNKSQGCVVEVCALTLQEAIDVNVLLAMSLLQIRKLVKVLENNLHVLLIYVIHMKYSFSLFEESLSLFTHRTCIKN